MKIYKKDTIDSFRARNALKKAGLPRIPGDVSPFRYPGGKAKLSQFLAFFILENDLLGCRLVEPFCGGAGGTLPLLKSNIIDTLVINDLNIAVSAFWFSVKNNADELIRMIRNEPITIERWHYWREVYKSEPGQYSFLELGFSVFFLNRTNRSGILHAGPIGGRNQLGNYKIDCRFNKNNLEKRISDIAEISHRIEVSCVDALDLIKKASINDLIYSDPPYVKEGKNIYSDFCFSEQNHIEFSNAIKRSEAKWLISYDDHPLVHQLYSTSGINVVEFSYVMNQAKVGRELLIASSMLSLPKMPDNNFFEKNITEKICFG